MSIPYALGLVLLAVASVAGQDSVPAPISPAPTPSAREQKSSDAQLQAEIEARFAKSKISENDFQVRVSGGVATLTGRTPIPQHKGTATRLARLAGAEEVHNQIEVIRRGDSRSARRSDSRSEPRSSEKRESSDEESSSPPRRVQVQWPEGH